MYVYLVVAFPQYTIAATKGPSSEDGHDYYPVVPSCRTLWRELPKR